jgi:hypothetical protein
MQTEQIKAIAADAQAFLHRMDVAGRRALFVRVSPGDLASASFLDERMGLQGRDGLWASLEDLFAIGLESSKSPIAPGFIFHIGHCGSTLLSRLLDTTPDVLGLREPLPLRDLAAAERDLDSPLSRLNPKQWDALLDVSLRLWCRPFSAQQRTIIKATSTCNNLIAPILQRDPGTKAVLLYQKLEPQLATMLKGAGGGMDALQAAPIRLAFLHEFLNDDSLRLHSMESSEIIAMGWVSDLARFHQLKASPSLGGRLLPMDFEQLLSDLPGVLGQVLRHLEFEIELDPQLSACQVAVMQTYAKSPSHGYSPSDRSHDLDLSRRAFAAEIQRGKQWAARLIDAFPQLSLLRPLLD